MVIKNKILHGGFSAFEGERKKEDRRKTKREEFLKKTSNFSARSNVNETKSWQSDQCPLADGTLRIWICPILKNLNISNRCVALKKQGIWYEYMVEGHVIKDCEVSACDINGKNKKHNQLLHSENKSVEGNHAINVSAATINQSNEETIFFR